ncbi:uncharacterized protein B0H18DRAFT_888611 [Fomitopsis serialis]|uniref:uncharacterized protein n=1 Tax=Fomitopsis serialis TaxID=139415 RepID=UPI0020073A8A|nr:uncharacterized protein B0H18DRAFT_888611 [Neoantrodia serialis]KAH9913272.1 hypothetical protein B0H18DRAFT_888611 [Neoantrodia serialis]
MGTVFSLYQQSFPPKPRWLVKDIPDQTGKVVLITGGNTGLGLETAKALIAKNAKVYITSRDEQRGSDAIDELKRTSNNAEVFLIQCDLSDLRSVKAAAENFLSKETQLHILFNNAGIMFPPMSELTKQGQDLQFGVNVIGHYYLTKLLLPAMLATVSNETGGKARVVNTSSSAMLLAPSGGINYDTLVDGPARRKFDNVKLYQQAKAGTVIFSTELARRYGDRGIVSISLNPGNIRTGIQRYVVGLQAKILDFVLYDKAVGVLTQLFAGTAPEAEDLNGKYLIPFARVGSARKDLLDASAGVKLWDWLEAQTQGV